MRNWFRISTPFRRIIHWCGSFCLRKNLFNSRSVFYFSLKNAEYNGIWGQNFTPVFIHIFANFTQQEFFGKFCCGLISFYEVLNSTWPHTSECRKYFTFGCLRIFLLILFWCFWPFFTNLWSYKVWMIILCLSMRDVIYANELT